MKIEFEQFQMDAIEEALDNMLPHGSGIDCKWAFEWNDALNTVKCSNSYHCMDENGFYDGYADFSITLYPLKALTAFRFQFHGKTAQYKNRKYQLRAYLEDTLYHALNENGNVNTYGIALLAKQTGN